MKGRDNIFLFFAAVGVTFGETIDTSIRRLEKKIKRDYRASVLPYGKITQERRFSTRVNKFLMIMYKWPALA